MALYNVRLFKNTGYNLENIPDRASLLNDTSINKLDVDAIWVYQNQDVGKIRVKTNFTDIYSVDYCRIGTNNNNQTFTYYFVTNVTMLNPVTCELDLQIDPITTIGLTNITNNILNGWCTRRCVTDDALFSNCIDENFSPTQPLEEDAQEIKISSNGILCIVSTIDLTEVNKKLSEGYKSSVESSSVDVSVPTVPAIDFNYSSITIDYQGLQLTRELVGKRMYIIEDGLDVAILKNALTTVWSLGLSDAIAGIYYLPIGESGNGNFEYSISRGPDGYWVKNLTVYGGFYSLDKIPFKWNTPNIKNNKVFASKYNVYRLLSMVSGNEAKYYAGDIYDKLNNPISPNIAINIDGSENGTSYAKPEYIRGVDLTQTSKKYEIVRDAVTGGDWVSANINMIRPKGLAKTLTDFNVNEAAATMSSLFDVLGNLPGLPNLTKNGNIYESYTMPYYPSTSLVTDEQIRSGALDQVSPITRYNYIGKPNVSFNPSSGFISSLFNARVNKLKRNIVKSNLIIQTPQTWFPVDNTLSLFYGNSYYVIRERLSDADTIKFDKYLTMYGYAVNEPLTKECFYGRQYFNYIECEDLNVGKLNVGSETGNIQECPLRLKQSAIQMLENGVRIWHTQVTQEAFNNNPIKTS